MEYLVGLLAAIALWGIAHANYQRRISLLWKRDNGELRDKVRELKHHLKEADQEINRLHLRVERRRLRGREDMPRNVARARGERAYLEVDDEYMEDYVEVPDNLVNFFHRLFEKFKEEEEMGDEKEETARRRKLNIESTEDETRPEMEEIDD